MYAKLNPPALGVGLGSLWAIVVTAITWLNGLTGGPFGEHAGWFAPMTRALDYALPGYYVGFLGGIWGGILAFLAGLAFGAFVARTYNRFANPVEEPPRPVVTTEEDEEDIK